MGLEIKKFISYPTLFIQKWMAQLEFELAYYDVIMQHINHFTTETPLSVI